MKRICILLMVILITACVGNIDKTSATDLDKYDEVTLKEKLTVGTTTKKDVLLLLGRPSLPEEYNNSIHWVYRSQKIDRRMYFLIPFNNSKNQMLSLNFTDAGVLLKYSYTDNDKI